MTMPTWWNERRLGLFVHTTVATVPAWAPLGEYAEWYRSHLGEDVDDVVLHPHPMVEVLAHHRDQWGHIERYDDFVPLLTFDEFDADEWAELASDAGAGYSVLVTKHHDGWAWWDAPGSERCLTDHGPHRNVVAEYAAACERNDLAFGTHYSLLDWGDPTYPDDAYVDGVLHSHVLDLVERFGSTYLWGDGHWGHDAGTWRTAQLLTQARAISPDIVVNDRWRASSHDVPEGAPALVRTFEYHPPDDITSGPWELARGIGHGFGHNRAERSNDHLTGAEIVELFTEVVAKGGHLLLSVGPTASGTVPFEQSAPIREAGRWIRLHHDLLARCSPWASWGDGDVRYQCDTDGSLVVVDIGGSGVFAELGASVHNVLSVERVDSENGVGSVAIDFEQEPDRLIVDTSDPIDPSTIPFRVYRIVHEDADTPVGMFSVAPTGPIPLAPLLSGARSGSIVRLAEATYLGPATVPAGVTVRGLGADRTRIQLPERTRPSIVPHPAVVSLDAGAQLEHVAVVGPLPRSDRAAPPVVSISGNAATLFGCSVVGSLEVIADDVLVRAVRARGVIAVDADRLQVSRCDFTGHLWDVGVECRGGRDQLVESTEFGAHLCAVRLSGTANATVRGNTISGRWWGVHAEHTVLTHVHGNRFRSTMRAVDIDGGTDAVVDGNSVCDGDSGCLVGNGAARCDVSGNHWDRCRVGLIAWDAVDLRHHDNVASGLRDTGSALVVGP